MSKLTATYPEPAEIWNAFVGDTTPLQFLQQQGCSDIESCVAYYVDPLPRFEGIVRQRDWRDTFTAEYQLRPEAVKRGLLDHLENTRTDWEPEWQGSEPVATEPVAAPVEAAVPSEPSESTESVESTENETPSDQLASEPPEDVVSDDEVESEDKAN